MLRLLASSLDGGGVLVRSLILKSGEGTRGIEWVKISYSLELPTHCGLYKHDSKGKRKTRISWDIDHMFYIPHP